MSNVYWNKDQTRAGSIVEEYYPQKDRAAEGTCPLHLEGLTLRVDRSDDSWEIYKGSKFLCRGNGKYPSPMDLELDPK